MHPDPHRDSSVLPAAQELPGAEIAGCQLPKIEPTPTQRTASTGPISLCKILQTLDASTKFLGSFPNATAEDIASITGERSTNSSKACDLGMLISNTGSALSNHHRLSDKSRLQIAIKLSSAVLQLYDPLGSTMFGTGVISTFSCHPAQKITSRPLMARSSLPIFKRTQS